MKYIFAATMALGLSLTAPFSFAVAAGKPIIDRAVWSGTDVTSVVAQSCLGKRPCVFKVDPAVIGAARNQSLKTFSIKWHCGADDPWAFTLPTDATGQSIEISCPGYVEKGARALLYPSSVHSLAISDSDQNPVTSKLTPNCRQAIKQHLADGNTFESSNIKKFLMKIKDLPYTQAQDLEFFHYTYSTGLDKIAEGSAFEEIFSYLRKRPREDIEATNIASDSWYFYAAADPSSSSSYGNIQYRIYFDPETLVFVAGGDLPGQFFNMPKVDSSIQDELIKKFPALSSCRANSELLALSVLSVLAAEADQVGQIAYYGITHRTLWVQVLGPWAIKKLVRGTK